MDFSMKNKNKKWLCVSIRYDKILNKVILDKDYQFNGKITIEDKSKPLRIQGITGQDDNSRNEYIYFYQAEILGNWKKDDKPILVLQ